MYTIVYIRKVAVKLLCPIEDFRELGRKEANIRDEVNLRLARRSDSGGASGSSCSSIVLCTPGMGMN